MYPENYDAAAKAVESLTTDFYRHAGLALGSLTDMTSLKARVEANQTVTAEIMHYETMTLTRIENATADDVRRLAATVK